jgi:hypothetical protein
MISDEALDVRNQVVTLPTLTPRTARADRVRALCCARLDRDRRRARWLVAISRFGRNVVAPVLVGGLVALCGVDLLSNAVRAFTV